MTQFLTCTYHIRRPTRRKQDALVEAAELYTENAQMLLNWAQDHLDEIQENGRKKDKNGEFIEKYDGDSVRRAFPSMAALKLPMSSVLNDALISDISGAVAGYLQLVKADPRTQFPTAIYDGDEEQEYADAIEGLRTLGNDIDEERELVHALKRKPRSKFRPISYARSRDFALLCKPEEQHELYAWLPLLPSDNLSIPTYKFDGSMIELATGEPFKYKSKMGIIVKIFIPTDSENNWYNRRFLNPVLNGTAKIKTAKLSRRGEDWRLYVSFAIETPATYDPCSYLGVSMGSMERIAYAITELDGLVISEHIDDLGIHSLNQASRKNVAARQAQGKFIDVLHYKRQSQDEMLHKIADRLIASAVESRSMIVLEDSGDQKGQVANISKKSGRMSRMLAPWRKFEFILKYKCNLAGVPIRTGMWKAQAVKLCPLCGSECVSDKETNYKIVECSSCMMRKDKSVVASINLARRMNYVKKEWDKAGGYVAFHKVVAISKNRTFLG